ncbi:hypothetical protein CDG79_32850 [Nostoc sp. 'Peltigera membranacea cyanobiont' 232]|nr:hypothetical protein CDG79_32850 [Nostoc sp. 'Peltigera membranacea cyanobiont' 232]
MVNTAELVNSPSQNWKVKQALMSYRVRPAMKVEREQRVADKTRQGFSTRCSANAIGIVP